MSQPTRQVIVGRPDRVRATLTTHERDHTLVQLLSLVALESGHVRAEIVTTRPDDDPVAVVDVPETLSERIRAVVPVADRYPVLVGVGIVGVVLVVAVAVALVVLLTQWVAAHVAEILAVAVPLALVAVGAYGYGRGRRSS